MQECNKMWWWSVDGLGQREREREKQEERGCVGRNGNGQSAHFRVKTVPAREPNKQDWSPHGRHFGRPLPTVHVFVHRPGCRDSYSVFRSKGGCA